MLQRDLPGVLQALGSQGIAEITPCGASPESAPLAGWTDPAEQLDCRRRMEAIRELRRELAAASSTPDTPIAKEGVVASGQTVPSSKAAIETLQPRAKSLLAERQQWRERLARQEEAAREAADFCGADLPWLVFRPAESRWTLTGSIPEATWSTMLDQLRERAVIVGLGHRDDRRWFLLVSSPRHAGLIQEVLTRLGFRPQSPPVDEGRSPEERRNRANQEAQAARARLEALEAEVGTLVREAWPILDQVEQATNDEARCLDVQNGMPRTETTVLLSGWVPGEKADALGSAIRDATRGAYAFQPRGTGPEPARASPPTESMPVLLRHPNWLRPLAQLLTPYGWPRPDELVPTLFVGLGYLVMFGMMFGDVGHGALLILAALWGGHRCRAGSVAAREAWWVVGSAGGASVVFGMLYGSCFGFPGFKHRAWWRDPLDGDPLDLVSLALGVGIATITLGLILNVFNLVRRRDLAGACLDRFGVAGLAFYGCAIGWVRRGASGREAPGDAGLQWLMIGAGLALAAWWVREPLRRLTRRADAVATTEATAAESWGATLAQSTVEVFEGLLLYLANTVSFVRLAAYALSHAAILSASFLLAESVGTTPVWGPLAAAAVIAVGNVVALLIEGVIAAVQALRLQYYEFFGKFYAGAGRPFTAFRLSPVTAAAHPP